MKEGKLESETLMDEEEKANMPVTDGDENDNKPLSREEKKKQVEAILFACGQEIDVDRIAMLMQLPNKRGLKDIILELKKEYDERDSPLMIISGEEGVWKLTVRERYLGLVRTIAPHTELSKTILETLAVIAWKQPILQSEVINIRTNKAYEHITELEKMGFLVKEKHGRSFLLKLSQKFFEYFDIENEAKLRGLFTGVKDKGEFQQKMAEFANSLKQDLPLLMHRADAVQQGLVDENALVETQDAAGADGVRQDAAEEEPSEPKYETDEQMTEKKE